MATAPAPARGQGFAKRDQVAEVPARDLEKRKKNLLDATGGGASSEPIHDEAARIARDIDALKDRFQELSELQRLGKAPPPDLAAALRIVRQRLEMLSHPDAVDEANDHLSRPVPTPHPQPRSRGAP